MFRNVVLTTSILIIALLSVYAYRNLSGPDQQTIIDSAVNSLPTGIAKIYGKEPKFGSLLLMRTVNDTVWLTFDNDETCLLAIERDQRTTNSAPITELSPNDLLSSIGCNSSEHIRDKGTIATNESSQRILISAVLPRTHWHEEWHIERPQNFDPFDIVTISPYSVHLKASRSAIDASRRSGQFGQFFNLSISCRCGSVTMRTFVR